MALVTALAQALRFVRPYNYNGKIEERGLALKDELQKLAERLRTGDISLAVFDQQARARILSNAVQGAILGVAESQGIAPSKVKLTPEQRRTVNEAVAEQYKYFRAFVKDIKAQGKELTTAVDARAAAYHGVVRSTAQQARMREQGGQKMRWTRHKNDSCGTCLGNDGKVKTSQEWQDGGVWPAHGTACRGNCGCSLDPVG